jgi:zinc transport system ATP-binding protein
MPDRPVLEVRDCSISFGSHRILSDISFTVTRGETLAIVGPNGSGKSVLFRALLGVAPHEGMIHWAPGTRIGYVPQLISVDPDFPLTVEEFFGFKDVHRADAITLLDRVGVGGDDTDRGHARLHIREHIMSARLGTLSSGQIQRTLIAWALAGDTNVLMFDEPTSGIDVGGQQSVYGMLATLRKERGLTLLLISHDLGIVHAQADHVLCISPNLICHGTPQDALSPANIQKLYGGMVAPSTHANTHSHEH